LRPDLSLRTRHLLCLPLLYLSAACANGDAAQLPRFDGGAALELARVQTEFGPRVPGTEAHSQTMDWMEQHLRPLAAVVQRQPFDAYNPYAEETVQAWNLIASFYPDKTQRIMICAHWDSRPVADHNVPSVQEPIDGAVDGAAGTAILLQLARVLASSEARYGVDLVFFDAEDTGLTNAYPDYENWFQGSRYFSQVAKAQDYQPWFAILVDLVGFEGATYKKEEFSLQYAPDVVTRVWQIAASLGVEQFDQSSSTSYLYDDHWILNREGGIPSIDVTADIGDYEFWHTLGDTFDKLRAPELEAVGKVLVGVLYPR
jgi:glutaminyl-peptide cyclotransferase